MTKRAITLALLLALGACGLEPEAPAGGLDYFAYSAPEALESDVFDAVAFINEQAGCELTAVLPAEPYVQPIRLVEMAPNALGAARRGSAFEQKPNKRRILIAQRIASRATITVAHEIGHTLGLDHTGDGSVMAGTLEGALLDFTSEDRAYLQALCSLLPDSPTSIATSITIDHSDVECEH